jgi:hypothetical protein
MAAKVRTINNSITAVRFAEERRGTASRFEWRVDGGCLIPIAMCIASLVQGCLFTF